MYEGLHSHDRTLKEHEAMAARAEAGTQAAEGSALARQAVVAAMEWRGEKTV